MTVVDDWDGFGQRVTGSGTVQFDQVAVEPEWILPYQASFETPTTIGRWRRSSTPPSISVSAKAPTAIFSIS